MHARAGRARRGAEVTDVGGAYRPQAWARAVTVVRGDTLYSVARHEGTTVDALMAANGVTDPTRIFVGQRLQIPDMPQRAGAMAHAGAEAGPRMGGIPFGRKLTALIGGQMARGGPWGALNVSAKTFPRKGGEEDSAFAPATMVAITMAAMEEATPRQGTGGPGALPSLVSAMLKAPAPRQGTSRRPMALPGPIPRLAPARSQARPRPKATAHSGRPVFCYPVADATITSYFGFDPWRGSFHGGVDFAQDLGVPIVAAGAGLVTASGPCGAYGNCVVIDHGAGHETVYGHAERLHVVPGQRVVQGQKIADVGSTGRSTGPHLHFEVRRHNRCVEPLEYLSVLTDDDGPAASTKGPAWLFGTGRAAAAALRGSHAASSTRFLRQHPRRDARVTKSAAHLIALGR